MSNPSENADKIERRLTETPTGVGAWWRSFPAPSENMEKEAADWRVESASEEDNVEGEGKDQPRRNKFFRLKGIVKRFFTSWNQNEQKLSETLPPLLCKGVSSPFWPQKQQRLDAVPQGMFAVRQAWTFEYDLGIGKSDLDVADKTGGVGTATGRGEGDMTGVVIRDFAERLDAQGTVRQNLES